MKKGFTLIELLAVIIILAVLLTIVAVSITGILRTTKKNIYNNIQLKGIEKAAQNWVAENPDNLPPATTCGYITLSNLQTLGYIGKNILKASDLQEQGDFNIKIESESTDIYLKYKYELNPTNISDCISLIVAPNCFTFSNNTITDYKDSCPKKIYIPNKIDESDVLTIGTEAFKNKGLTYVIIPSSVETIKTLAFKENNSLKAIINNCKNNIPGINIEAEAFDSPETLVYKYTCENEL